jgi:hypothetical protein
MIVKYNDFINENIFSKLFNWLDRIGENIQGSTEIDKVFNDYKSKIK